MAGLADADYQPIDAVDYRREIHLASRYLELRDVSEQLLIRSCCLEVPIDEVLWR